MTASTAPITLPARHRVDLPTWRVHTAIALFVYGVALAAWTVRAAPQVHGKRHVAVVAAATTLIAVAIAGLVLP